MRYCSYRIVSFFFFFALDCFNTQEAFCGLRHRPREQAIIKQLYHPRALFFLLLVSFLLSDKKFDLPRLCRESRFFFFFYEFFFFVTADDDLHIFL